MATMSVAFPTGRRHAFLVWMTHGIWVVCRKDESRLGLRIIEGHQPFIVGDFEIHSVPVPHDAREPSRGIGRYW